MSDYNLIECGDDVVIGGGVHLSGHTVEAGVVKTAPVRLGNKVTIGLGSVVEIGVEIGSVEFRAEIRDAQGRRRLRGQSRDATRMRGDRKRQE